MCGFYHILFIECMIAGKILSDYASLFSRNEYQKNDKTIHKNCKDRYGKRKRKP